MTGTAEAFNKKYGVLYVDDEQNNLNSFKAAFRMDFLVYTAISAKEGRKTLEQQEIGVLITDQRMPVVTGIEFLKTIRPIFPDIIRILLTGFADIAEVNAAIANGLIYKYIGKPWQDDDLRLSIAQSIELYHLRKENKELVKMIENARAELELKKSR
jgi:response regulator RpfG family c-di-GMP phosphodiesterase